MIDTTQTYRIPETVMVRPVAEESVLLDLAGGTYFGLDAVGSRIWQLLQDGKSVASICDTIAAEYDAAPDQIAEDTEALLIELVKNKLIIQS